MNLWPFRWKRRPVWAWNSSGPASPRSIAWPRVTDFARRLTETVAWCSDTRGAGAKSLGLFRTPILQPGDIVNPPVYQENGDWWKLPEEARWLVYGKAQIERRRMVSALAEKRADLLRQEGTYPEQSMTHLAGGNLLVYAPDEQFADGFAEAETEGFFNVFNAPPWDTWVDYVQEDMGRSNYGGTIRAYVVCWIPPPLLATAERGVSVNTEGSIGWLNHINTHFTQELHRGGLLEQ